MAVVCMTFPQTLFKVFKPLQQTPHGLDLAHPSGIKGSSYSRSHTLCYVATLEPLQECLRNLMRGIVYRPNIIHPSSTIGRRCTCSFPIPKP